MPLASLDSLESYPQENSWPPLPAKLSKYSSEEIDRIRSILESDYSLSNPLLVLPGPESPDTCINSVPIDEFGVFGNIVFSRDARLDLLQVLLGKSPGVTDLPLHVLRACKLSELRRCENISCRLFRDILERHHQPACSSWPQLLDWATQMAACVCAANGGHMFAACFIDKKTAVCDKCRRYMTSSLAKTIMEDPDTVGWRFRLVSQAFSRTPEFSPYISKRKVEQSFTVTPGFRFVFDEIDSLALMISDIFNVLSWVEGMINIEMGRWMSPLWDLVTECWNAVTSNGSQKTGDGAWLSELNLESPLEAAWAKVDRSGLCPARIWGVLKTIPGDQHHISPFLDVPFNIPKHREHVVCNYGNCDFATINYTSVEQLHKCRDKQNCKLTDSSFFSKTKLDEACLMSMKHQLRSSTMAWSLDGQRLIHHGEKYMAISHVWADGTGAGAWPSGRVNKCLFDFWAEWARDQGCEGVWWDTICIPGDKIAKQHTINKMHTHFENAYCTLVHDKYLCESVEWDDDLPGKGAFALVLSTWFTRGWTALELICSKRVKVLFKAPRTSKAACGRSLVIKDLDLDILAHPRLPSSRYHQLATFVIRRLRRMYHSMQLVPHNLGGSAVKLHLNRVGDQMKASTINDLLISLQMRVTSWARDRALIPALMADVRDADKLATTQELYQALAKKIRFIHYENLLHGLPTMNGHFSWLPHSMLDMPISGNTEFGYSTRHTCKVADDGRVVGKWKVRFLHQQTSPKLPSSLVSRNTSSESSTAIYQPASTHPFHRMRIANAQVTLEQRKRHAVLIPVHINRGKGVLVRIIRISTGEIIKDMFAEYIGCVMCENKHGSRVGRNEELMNVCLGGAGPHGPIPNPENNT